MVNVIIHPPRSSYSVVEPVLDFQVFQDDVGRGDSVAQHHAAVPEGLTFLLDDGSLDPVGGADS